MRGKCWQNLVPISPGRVVLIFCALWLFVGPVRVLYAQGNGRSKVLKGNEYFMQKKYDEANNAYRDAQLDNPTSPIIDYNIANTLYEKHKYEEAIKRYDKVLRNSDDPLFQAQTYYNMGNALYRLHKLPESILAYQEALKLNPNDEDAKYNLEYVRAKLKQEAKKQPQQQQQQQQQKQQQQQNQKNQSQDQNQQQEQEQQQQENQEQMAEQQNQAEQQQQKQAKKQKGKEQEISKEDAERILNALQNEEKDLQKARKIKAKGRRKRTTKDW